MKNAFPGACTKEGEPCLWEKGFQTVAGYLEGEGIFCRRINRSETRQVAYPQLYSVAEKTKQSEDQVYILPTPGSVPPWLNAIFDCMSTVLQVFASFLFR